LLNTYNYNVENSPPPGTVNCNIRWLKQTVTTIWDKAWTYNPGDEGTSEEPYEVYDVEVIKWGRRMRGINNPRGISSLHKGSWRYDTLQAAKDANAAIHDLIWYVTDLTETYYKVDIQFMVGVNTFTGSREVHQEEAYDLDTLIADLKILWDKVQQERYPWGVDPDVCQNNLLDIFVCYAPDPALTPPETLPDVFQNDPPNENPYTIQASALGNMITLQSGAHYGENAISLFCGNEGGGLDDVPQDFRQPELDGSYFDALFMFASLNTDCVALIKSRIREAPDFTQSDITKAFPLNDANKPTCNPVWDLPAVDTHMTTLECERWVYPISGGGHEYRPGVRRIIPGFI